MHHMDISDKEIRLRKQVKELNKQLHRMEQICREKDEGDRNFQQILYNAVDPILLIAGETFIDCNDATVKILAAEKKAEVLSTHPSELSPEFQPDGQSSFEKANEMIRIAFETGFHRFEWMHKKLTGEVFPVEVSLTTMELNGQKVLHTLWKDLTNQKNSEKTLRDAMERAEKANQAKSEFLSSMSHELRTPLNAILGFAQILNINDDNPLSEFQKGAIRQILNSGQHLLDLINDVLNMARIESGKIEITLEKISTQPLLEECASSSRALIDENSNIKLLLDSTATETCYIFADKTRTRQIIFNMLSNAIKYNAHDGKVILSCKTLPDKMVRISVEDTGKGIAPEKQQHIFEPFNRLGAATTTIQGTGIGLSIAKKLVEQMNGRIDFTSSPGKGSTFWIDLPAINDSRASSLALQDNIKTEKPLPKELEGHMLYIEDNPGNQLLMQAIVKTAGNLTLTSALDAEQGISAAISSQPDIIILDINLPGMSGWEALSELKNNEMTAQIPVIALSAAASESDIQKGLQSGFADYLTKPFDLVKLAAILQKFL